MEEREYQSLKSQIESKLAQADKRLTGNMVKIVVCTKCNRHRTPYGYYPTKPCQCGSYESEERDTTLEELFAESQELSQLRPIVQALRELLKNRQNYFGREQIESILASSEVSP